MAIINKGQESPEMSIWRQRLWPVYNYELKKFIPMVMIMFWILFSYTVVRNIKDTLLVNAPHSSSHVLPWAKILFVTPASILFVILYARLSNIFTKEKLYYSCLIPFGLFFLLFGFLIFPFSDYFNASPETILSWQESVPFFQDFFPIVGYWTFTLFYTMAELWGNVGVALLFWQFANQITPTSEAKRFYPIFGFWSNLGLISAGLLVKYAQHIVSLFLVSDAPKATNFLMQVKLLCGCVGFGCFVVGMIYWWMNKNVLTDPRYYDEANLLKKGKEKKPKLSIGESIKFLLNSKYLGYITILVLAYGVTINIVEISWKDALKTHFKGDHTSYQAFTGDQYVLTGIVTMILIGFSQNILRSFGWRSAAIVTPWMALITGGLFFFFFIFKDLLSGVCALIDMTPIGVAIWIGLFQNVLTKGAKYSLFDPTKEMAYIPLDEESKIKGKAAIDVIGGRAGKSGGSVINMVVRSLVNTLRLPSNVFFVAVGGVMALICMWWVWAVNKLSKSYQEKLDEKQHSGK